MTVARSTRSQHARLLKLRVAGVAIAVLAVLIALVAGSVFAATAMARSSAKVVKLAIMTDCKGAFGFGYEPDIGGAEAGFAVAGAGANSVVWILMAAGFDIGDRLADRSEDFFVGHGGLGRWWRRAAE